MTISCTGLVIFAHAAQAHRTPGRYPGRGYEYYSCTLRVPGYPVARPAALQYSYCTRTVHKSIVSALHLVMSYILYSTGINSNLGISNTPKYQRMHSGSGRS